MTLIAVKIISFCHLVHTIWFWQSLPKHRQKERVLHLWKALSNHDQNCSVGRWILIVSTCNVLYLMRFCSAPDIFQLAYSGLYYSWEIISQKAFKTHFVFSPENQSKQCVFEKWCLMSKQAVSFPSIYYWKNRPFLFYLSIICLLKNTFIITDNEIEY